MKRLACLALVFGLAACSPNVETRGHLRDADWKAQVVPEQTTQAQVLELLGSPSTKASFGDETWYYITTRRENIGFMKPEVADEEVVEIAFNPDTTVKSIQITGKDKARDITFSSRETPTEGHQLTFMEQLLGNMGRFNAPAGVASSPGSNRRN